MDYLPFAAEFVAPFVLAAILPARLRGRMLVLTGLAAYVAVCFFAHRAGLVENGGDSSGGTDEVLLVAVINALHFLPLWALGSFLGSRARSRRHRPVSSGSDYCR